MKGISETALVTEASIKSAISDYLQYKTNAGEIYADRLNSGDFIEARGNTRRRIRGCRKGTADFFVLQSILLWDGVHATRIRSVRGIFLEIKSPTGKQSPEQVVFQKLVENQGGEYHIVRSVDEVMEVLK